MSGSGHGLRQDAVDTCADSPAGDTRSALTVTPRELCDIDGQPWTWSSFSHVFNSAESITSDDRRCYDTFLSAHPVALRNVQPASNTFAVGSETQDPPSGHIMVATFDRGGRAAVRSLDRLVEHCRLDTVDRAGWAGYQEPGGASSKPMATYWHRHGSAWALVQVVLPDEGAFDDLAKLDSDVTTVLRAQAGKLDAR